MTFESVGMTSDRRTLLLHADDFGMRKAVTDGIIDCFRRGLLTSTSIMSNAPDCERAISLWSELQRERAADALPSSASRKQLGDPATPFDLGVHLNLTLGKPLTNDYPRQLLNGEGSFPGAYVLFGKAARLTPSMREAVRLELSAQIDFLVNRGVLPTHLNGHQYVEMMPNVAEIVADLAAQRGISYVRCAKERRLARVTLFQGQPLAWVLGLAKRRRAGFFEKTLDRAGLRHADVYFGSAHAGRIDLSLMRHFLRPYPQDRVIEIAFHPSAANDSPSSIDWADSIAEGRPREMRLLTSQELLEELLGQNVRLGRMSRE